MNNLYYVFQHIEMDKLCQKFKIDFLLFPIWLFVQLKFGASDFEILHCIFVW